MIQDKVASFVYSHEDTLNANCYAIAKGDPLKMIEIRDKWTLEPFYTCLSMVRQEQIAIEQHQKEMQKKMNNR